jgi:hypothetical protein
MRTSLFDLSTYEIIPDEVLLEEDERGKPRQALRNPDMISVELHGTFTLQELSVLADLASRPSLTPKRYA